MNKNIMLLAIYNELLLNNYTGSEEYMRCLVSFRQKVEISINYWNDEIHALHPKLMDLHKDIFKDVVKMGEIAFIKYGLLDDKLDAVDRFNRKFDKIVDNCPYIDKFIRAYGNQELQEGTIPDDKYDTKGDLITKTPFFHHIIFYHYVKMIELHYFDYLKTEEEKKMFANLSLLTEELCDKLWRDINEPFIAELIELKKQSYVAYK